MTCWNVNWILAFVIRNIICVFKNLCVYQGSDFMFRKENWFIGAKNWMSRGKARNEYGILITTAIKKSQIQLHREFSCFNFWATLSLLFYRGLWNCCSPCQELHQCHVQKQLSKSDPTSFWICEWIFHWCVSLHPGFWHQRGWHGEWTVW